jgi:hypothetical protein
MRTLAQDLGRDGPWNYWYSYTGRIGSTLRRCDAAIATNEFLAGEIRSFAKIPTRVVSNFLCSEPTLLNLLERNPNVVLRLVGYIKPIGGLEKFASRIEVHRFRDFVNLQALIGSTEINLVPLQDNIFTNCKSELKFFEAAVVGTITVASPVFAYRNAMQDGLSGFLAGEHNWQSKIDDAISSLNGDACRYKQLVEEAGAVSRSAFGCGRQLATIEQALFPE